MISINWCSVFWCLNCVSIDNKIVGDDVRRMSNHFSWIITPISKRGFSQNQYLYTLVYINLNLPQKSKEKETFYPKEWLFLNIEIESSCFNTWILLLRSKYLVQVTMKAVKTWAHFTYFGLHVLHSMCLRTLKEFCLHGQKLISILKHTTLTAEDFYQCANFVYGNEK